MLAHLKQLISNPATGRLSTSDTTLFGAFIASTAVLLWCALAGKMDEYLFVGYLAAWVTHSQASKQAAIKRDREQRVDVTENREVFARD
ncbi:hypothetical protein [Photorhabdus tasmaniensis]|uniref:DUF2644 domain-containing protein n=1 Tax=Photorhabdus tasmaniensis TaxID=1004159 RepID=A0ABX0GJ52_9GAMM|nr:hypothetical protein [Photorhabdus tasmaniensis]NHB89207.1 hypothetical protein [Photorhabdus tasmaniensis]